MATTKKQKTEKSAKDNKAKEQQPKSKIALFWEENPNGIGGRIVNMRAVLR